MIRTSDGAMQRQFGVLFDAGSLGGWGDGALLDRFLAGRDAAAEAAFAALVERHGPMVLRVCRAALGDEHDAHDAFQATFLILARKARSVRIRDTVGPWLHGVAWRVASRARAAGYRRRRHERRAAEMAPRSFEESRKDDAEATLHEEVRRLPAGFREAVILCDLEGLTTDQAAERLGTPVGTVRSRLYRGRDRLRGRLLRRGLAPASVGLVVASGTASAVMVPAALAEATVGLAVGCCWAGAVPIRLAWLVNGGRYAMGMKSVAAVGLSLGLVAGVGGYAAQGPGDGPGAKVESRRGEPGEKVRAVEAPVADPTATDRERLQGSWTIVSARENGREADEPSILLSKVTFRGNELRLALRGKGDARYVFSIDPDSQPRAMLLAPPDPKADRPQWCLYAFERNRLRLAFDMTMKRPGRPASFDEKDAEHPIAVLELVRDERPPAGASSQPGAAPPAEASPDAPGPKLVAADREQLQGTWSVIKASVDGREIGGPGILFAPMTFKGDVVMFGPFGNPPVENRYRFLIDPEGEPRALRVVGEGGKPRWWLYSLKGDKLRTAAWHSIDDPRRPQGFDDGGDNNPLMVLELVRNVAPPATAEAPPRADRPPDPLPVATSGVSVDVLEVAPASAVRLPSPTTAAPGSAELTPTSALPPAPEPAAPADAALPPPTEGPTAPAPASVPLPARPSEPALEPDEVLPPSVTPGIPAPGPLPEPQPLQAPPPVNPTQPPEPQPQPPAQSDSQRLQGTWSILALEEDGREVDPGTDSTVLFAGNALVIVRGGRGRGPMAIEAGNFGLDGREQRWIKLMPTGGSASGMQLGIYRIDGASLLLSLARAGGPRPTEFDTAPGSGQRLFVLRRKRTPGPAAGLMGAPGRGWPRATAGRGPGMMPGQPVPGQPVPDQPRPQPVPSPAVNPTSQPLPAPRAEPSPSAAPAPAPSPGVS